VRTYKQTIRTINDSNVYWFEGNFQDYEENRKKRLGGDPEASGCRTG